MQNLVAFDGDEAKKDFCETYRRAFLSLAHSLSFGNFGSMISLSGTNTTVTLLSKHTGTAVEFQPVLPTRIMEMQVKSRNISEIENV